MGRWGYGNVGGGDVVGIKLKIILKFFFFFLIFF